MKLEQFKEQLESDAQRRCLEQEKTIQNLIYQNKHLQALLKDRDESIEMLQRRCIVQSHGIMCVFCTMRSSCHARKERQNA